MVKILKLFIECLEKWFYSLDAWLIGFTTTFAIFFFVGCYPVFHLLDVQRWTKVALWLWRNAYSHGGKRVKRWRSEKVKEWRVSSPCHSRLSAYVLSAVYIPCEPRREREWTRFSAWADSLKILFGISGVCQTARCHVTAGLLTSVTNSTISSKKRSERAKLRKSNYFTFFLLWKREMGITAPKTRVNSISRLS